MGRYVSRPRITEGRGMGERFTEVLVVIAILAGIGWGAKWYFMDYKNSPGFALQNYMGALKAGDLDTQYKLLAASTKKVITSASVYDSKYPPARGFQGRLVNYELGQVTGSGTERKCDVKVSVRKANQDILQTATDDFIDHYVLNKDPEGWRVALELSTVDSAKSVGRN